MTGLHAFASPTAADDALLAARNKLAIADTRLAEAHDEAQAIISDAVAQANLLTGNATRVAERLLADAERGATEARAVGESEARALREQVEQERVSALADDEQAHRQLIAELAERRDAHERELLGLREAATAELAARAAAAEQEQSDRIAAASAAAEAELAAASSERAATRSELESARAELARQIKQQLEAASAEAARLVAVAEEHTRWAQQTMRGVLEAAELEAAGLRAYAHRESADATRRVRQQVARVLARSRGRLGDRVAMANLQAAEVTRKADETFEQSIQDADLVRERAALDATRIVSEAEELAGEHTARAERRLAESESGARTIREQVALEVTRTQEELNELWRTAKSEQAATSAAAREEADHVRTTARRLLADARAEVETLSRRRDAIAAELGSLSGVIEALAVAESEPADSERRAEPAERDQPEVAQELPAGSANESDADGGQSTPDRELHHRPRPGKPVPAPWQDPEVVANPQPMSLLEEMMRSE